MQQIQFIVAFLLLWFISTATCQSANSITECEKRCPIKSIGSFEENEANGVHKNLSHCLAQNECFNIDDCSKMLTQHYCHSKSCAVTCEVAEPEPDVPPQRARTKRFLNVHLKGAEPVIERTKRLFHLHLHYHGSASRPIGMSVNLVVAAVVIWSLGNILL